MASFGDLVAEDHGKGRTTGDLALLLSVGGILVWREKVAKIEKNSRPAKSMKLESFFIDGFGGAPWDL